MEEQKQRHKPVEGDEKEMIDESLATSAKKARWMLDVENNKRRDDIVDNFISTKAKQKHQMILEQEEEERLKNDGENDSFHSAEVMSSDNDYSMEQLRQLKETSIETDVLRRMNQAFIADEEIKMVEGGRKGHQNHTRRLSKIDLSSPELRMKKFNEMFQGNEGITVDSTSINRPKSESSSSSEESDQSLSEEAKKERDEKELNLQF